MTAYQKTRMRTAALCGGVILAAWALRIAAGAAADGFTDKLANFLRIFLYLGLFSVWGISVRRRVVQAQARRLMTAVSVLTVFWLTAREYRWHLVLSEAVRRWLWYAYYIPILLIPLTALLVSLSLGKSESYRLPRWTGILYAPTLALIALALTNDLHGWMFTFPGGGPGTAELQYGYGPAFYAAAVWGAACALAAFIVMLAKCRIPRRGKILWLPLIPFGCAVAYILLYALRTPVAVRLLGDTAVVDCLLFTAFLESCIQCGLIQSNTRYADLFRASVGIAAQIADRDYRVRWAARDGAPAAPEDMRRAEAGPVLLPEGRRLHSMPIRGGHALWSEDISGLLALGETLEARQEELRERNGLLRLEYERERDHRIVEERNRLYDLLWDKTRSQLARIEYLTGAYAAGTEEERRRILAEILVLGSYIKRRRDLVLAMESGPEVPEAALESAFRESLRALTLFSVRGGCLVDTGREQLPGETVARAYDFFEEVLERELGRIRFLSVRVCAAGEGLRCAVLTDGAGEDISRRFPEARVLRDEDGAEYILPLEGGRRG